MLKRISFKNINDSYKNLIVTAVTSLFVSSTIFSVCGIDSSASEVAEEFIFTENYEEEVNEPDNTYSVYDSAMEILNEAEKVYQNVLYYNEPMTLYTISVANLRVGPGTDREKCARLDAGTELTATGETYDGWYEVSYGGTAAYIRSDYTTSEAPVSASPEDIPVLFVGDSRTVGLGNAVNEDNRTFIAKVGKGYDWFKSTALSEINRFAARNTVQNSVIIINFGVNDLGNVDKYISLVNSNVDTWISEGYDVCYSSVTPVSSYPTVTNAQIEDFNRKMKENLDPRVQWIDSYSYMVQNGFNTSDGLHYTSDTYRNLYDYYMDVLSKAA